MNTQGQEQSKYSRDWSWPFWPALPLYPYGQRRTIRREIVKDTIWTFEQVQGILYTIVPIRMTVIKLQAGGLLVYAPVAPTRECVRLVKELAIKHGEVKYILLPTSSGLEHKIFVGPFAKKFPQALVYVAPHQWSFPFNLPLSWFGFPQKRTFVLPEDSDQAPFGNEFNYTILDINLGRGSFVEVALLHKASGYLLVTDTIVSIPENPPEILHLYPEPLLFHARENAQQPLEDNEFNRRQGWQRIAIFATYFRPSAVEISSLQAMWKAAKTAPDRSAKVYFGFYPFRWQDNWQSTFAALHGQGRPFVAPILQILILPQAPQQVLAWAETIANWDFQHIISCHFDAPIHTNGNQFRQAFSFLEKYPQYNHDKPLLEADLQFIKNLEADLLRRGIATPAKEKV
ncbi:hypothetical protein B6N60_04758 [Richelia sinica FACHB-800]|uniref:DUF4336 domain-containing protein n=1 Tax=Richelia sinica FACHB-800 TaxID=1357546 RepID=A0A975TC08_9NOST|nr:DUF4336 domain-containing protein [Richelia sinica]MBD2667277.1 DUF4336 domain-containing protein [Richelia sinica FACHB-800]QXE26031.1 hypothetical protein B6N60_04758 [Richelia sinica FACHB-800]